MNLFRRVFWISLFFAVLSAGVCSAQTVDFTLLLTVPGQQPVTFLPDTTIQFSANTPTATITAQYIGNSAATISLAPAGPPPWLVGSTEFTISVPKTETFPLVLGAGQSLTFTVTFKPVSPSAAFATITIPYTEPNPAPGATGPLSNAIVIPIEGVVPSVTFAYAFSNGNAHSIASGGTIPFPPTPLNTPATATLAIVNTGSGAAEITGITYPPSTSPFQVSGVPLATPAVPYPLIAGGSALGLTITYTPTAVENDTGQITFTFQDGTTDTINFSGSGVTSTLTYCTLSGTTCTSLATGGTVSFPAVTVATSGSTPTSSSVIVQVKNTGAATATINSVNVSGPFAVTSTQTFPITLAQGNTTSFTIGYTPTQVGSCSTNSSQCGTLVIGNAAFTLSGTGLGPQLTFSYSSAGTTVSLGTSGEVIFPNTQVSQSVNVPFTITNSGTTSTTLVLVSASPSPPFSVPTVGPVTLAAGKSTTFPITFTPATTGSATGTLNINNMTVGLLGAGTSPPTLPSYTIAGPSGAATPATQAPISLTLAKSYPVDLEGVLTLTTSGTLPTDPSVQFSTGSSAGNRTVDFIIPAGSTSANFVNQGSQIFVQTGTVAETVTLAPSFTTSGGVDLTPSSPQTLQFTIAPAAPVLQGLQIVNATGSPTSASFDVVLTGYSTTRDLSTLNVTFTPASGFNLTTSQASENISAPSSAWFQSSTSVDSYGGLFQVTIAFNLTGSVAANQSLLEAISSVSATISNSVGTSSSQQASLQ